jgi:hypothetical protein
MRGLLPSGFPTKILYEIFVSVVHDTCVAHVVFLGFISLMIFGEEYEV